MNTTRADRRFGVRGKRGSLRACNQTNRLNVLVCIVYAVRLSILHTFFLRPYPKMDANFDHDDRGDDKIEIGF